MGAVFKLEHTNIMAYVTSRTDAPPRVPRRHLSEFLNVMAYESERYLIPEPGFEEWSHKISAIAQHASTRLEEIADSHETLVLFSSTVRRLLEDLRIEFADYSIYALAVGADERLREIARELAMKPMYGQHLVLIPEYHDAEHNFEVLDPAPAFSAALNASPDWPGFLFWTQTGTTAFARLDDALRLADELRHGMEDPRPFPPFHSRAGLDQILRRWTKEMREQRSRRLLHLSDLHFGTADATENQALLDAELRDIAQDVDRVVITGDLCDTPNSNYLTAFTNFRNNITHMSGGREPISITGNHDQRLIGLIGDNYKQVAVIGSQSVIVDDHCEMIFICFNSSEKGQFARGKITASQFRRLGGEYRTLLAARPKLKKYLPIVLVHHHPFSFDVQPETLMQRVLCAVGFPDESFLKMIDAEHLHQWCLDWKIKTILHGHKHKARYAEREIVRDSDRMRLTAIGCGSSLGAGGSPVSYNILQWNSNAQRWVVSFFQSSNGGAFREIVTAVSPHRPV